MLVTQSGSYNNENEWADKKHPATWPRACSPADNAFATLIPNRSRSADADRFATPIPNAPTPGSSDAATRLSFASATGSTTLDRRR